MNTDCEIKLTEYSRGAGCGCKISPSVLKEILQTTDDFPLQNDLLIGNESNDDAAVLDLKNGDCLISTNDFFMPIVNDAFDFGRIASSNALSDVYAMGGKPILALAILGWPVDKLPASQAQQVLEGARYMCRIAGISLAGGHSVDSAEPFFGLAVNGIVKKENIKRNNTAQVGDLLFITKPLGLGIVATAHKRGLAKAEDFESAISYMCSLNKIGEELGKINGVTALTDVTGFGLLGHLIEMCDHNRLSATIDYNKIPILACLSSYLEQMIYPDMTMKNFAAFSSSCSTLNAQQLFVLNDPQTSGGLMVAVNPNVLHAYLELVRSFGLQGVANICIGRFENAAAKTVLVQ